jgi:FMN phosphatase YigB (HAD superfamily)
MTQLADITSRLAAFAAVTCDVFDTAVVRRLARPEDVHLATGLRLCAAGLCPHPADAFRAYRLAAENTVRTEAAAREIDEPRLADIYAHLAACGIVGDAAGAARHELAAEIAACQAVLALKAALATRPAGQPLLFVSDSPLPGPWIAEILVACGYPADIAVISSADAGVSKHSGRLFPVVAARLGLDPARIIHIGDNPHSDGRNARAAGFATVALPPPGRPPEQLDIAARAPVLRLLHSARRSAVPPAPEGLHRYASLLAIGWTLDILAQARRRGIRRIYFLARDGYLPLAIARRLVDASGEDFELRYLEVSRQAVVVPTMDGTPAALAEFAGYSIEGRPLVACLGFLGVDAAVTAERLLALGLDPARIVDGAAGRADVARLFAAEPALVQSRLAALRDDARAYLDQEGFLAPGPRMIVDVGWRGSTQVALARLAGLPADDILGAYLGLLPAALRPGVTPATARGYLFAFGHPEAATALMLDGYALPELLFSAPHGAVLGYARQADGMRPRHAQEAEPGGSLRRAAMEAIVTGVLAEFDAIDALVGGAWEEIDPDSACRDLAALLASPSAAEVAAINAIPFINGADGSTNRNVLNRMPLHALLRHPRQALVRARSSPWRAGWVRLHLPWPLPAMTYASFRHRMARLGFIAPGG